MSNKDIEKLQQSGIDPCRLAQAKCEDALAYHYANLFGEAMTESCVSPKPLTIDDLKSAADLMTNKTHYVFCHSNNLEMARGDLFQKGELDTCDVRPSRFCSEFDKDGKRHYIKVDKSKMFLPRFNPITDLFVNKKEYKR